MAAKPLRSAIVVLLAATSVGLTVGSANAETATATSTSTAAEAELEAPGTADSGIRGSAPTAEERREKRELRNQRREVWWAHARVVLFSDIQLSAEQSRGVDEIIETQLDKRRRYGEQRAELKAAQQQADTERSAALRVKSRALRAQLKDPHECVEEMRAFVSEQQRPTFDMNRAQLVAEGQQPQQKRRRNRPTADAEVKAE